MQLLDIVWLAGLLEGEGCFDCSKLKGGQDYQPRIRLKMTDGDVVRNAAAIMGNPRLTVEHLPSDKTAYTLCVVGDKAVVIMEAILPYMGNRRTMKIREIIVEWNQRKAA